MEGTVTAEQKQKGFHLGPIVLGEIRAADYFWDKASREEMYNLLANTNSHKTLHGDGQFLVRTASRAQDAESDQFAQIDSRVEDMSHVYLAYEVYAMLPQ